MSETGDDSRLPLRRFIEKRTASTEDAEDMEKSGETLTISGRVSYTTSELAVQLREGRVSCSNSSARSPMVSRRGELEHSRRPFHGTSATLQAVNGTRHDFLAERGD